MELSVILVNLNAKDLTVDCIRSIRKEAEGVSFELILVDNGSTDGSVDVFRKIKEENFWNGRFSLIINKKNLGYAKANNQGIEKAHGDYILLLNNDTIVHKGALQNLLKFAKDASDAGVVGSKLLNKDGSTQPSCYHFPTIGNAFREFWLGQKGAFEKYFPKADAPTEVDSVVGAAFMVTPAARKNVGVLDERYFAYFEDIDYCRRVWKKGLKVYYLPSSLISHYHGATFKKLANKEDQWKKLIPSSKIYHGIFKHYILNTVIWTGQKWQNTLGKRV